MILLSSNRVYDTETKIVRNLHKDEDTSTYLKLDVDYKIAYNNKVIDDYLVNMIGSDADKNKLVKSLSSCLTLKHNNTIIIHGEKNTGQEQIVNIMKYIFGSNCTTVQPEMFMDNTVKREYDLNCFRTNKLIIIENFNEWDNLDYELVTKIQNKEPMSYRKLMIKKIRFVPQCCLLFTSTISPTNKVRSMNRTKVHELASIFNMDNYDIVNNKKDDLFTYMIDFININPRIERRDSFSRKFMRTISTRLSAGSSSSVIDSTESSKSKSKRTNTMTTYNTMTLELETPTRTKSSESKL